MIGVLIFYGVHGAIEDFEFVLGFDFAFECFKRDVGFLLLVIEELIWILVIEHIVLLVVIVLHLPLHLPLFVGLLFVEERHDGLDKFRCEQLAWNRRVQQMAHRDREQLDIVPLLVVVGVVDEVVEDLLHQPELLE